MWTNRTDQQTNESVLSSEEQFWLQQHSSVSDSWEVTMCSRIRFLHFNVNAAAQTVSRVLFVSAVSTEEMRCAHCASTCWDKLCYCLPCYRSSTCWLFVRLFSITRATARYWKLTQQQRCSWYQLTQATNDELFETPFTSKINIAVHIYMNLDILVAFRCHNWREKKLSAQTIFLKEIMSYYIRV